MRTFLLGVAFMALMGCTAAPPPPVETVPQAMAKMTVDSSRLADHPTEEQLRTNPALQKVCDAVGGCQNVDLECVVYDDTGNSNLRGDMVWTVSAAGVEGKGFRSFSKGRALDAAARSWINIVKTTRQEQPTMYPNSHPCRKEECR